MIPIENIYYLLCYAWDKLDEKEKVSVTIDSETNLLDLLAKVLINGSKRLLKKGIAQNYMTYTNEMKGVKGKIEIAHSLKTNLFQKKMTCCSYDDLSSDILLNQILVSTLNNLTRTKDLNKGLKADLIKVQRMFVGIERIKINKKHFKSLQISRNQHFYSFLMNVCELIHLSSLPDEKEGRFLFMNFSQDERKMNQLFEAFVRNFYKVEMKDIFQTSRETILWQFGTPKESNRKYLPQMQTDITLENANKKIIIDAKYYKETMALNYDKEKIHSSHLYQLNSYLLHQQSSDPKTKCATGILLYPTIEEEFDLHFTYEEHNIFIKTINLNTHWSHISKRLKEIVL